MQYMNLKKFAVFGVLALVVIGCVLAAGCTGQVNTDPDQVNPASGAISSTYDPIVGTWIGGDNMGIKYVFSSDHTCSEYFDKDGEFDLHKSLTWNKKSDGIYTLHNDGSYYLKLNMNEQKDTFYPTEVPDFTFYKQS